MDQKEQRDKEEEKVEIEKERRNENISKQQEVAEKDKSEKNKEFGIDVQLDRAQAHTQSKRPDTSNDKQEPGFHQNKRARIEEGTDKKD
eukprot:2528593-Heterocapsa_arctica.AAC.1